MAKVKFLASAIIPTEVYTSSSSTPAENLRELAGTSDTVSGLDEEERKLEH
jgi:hypothetical protein